MRKCIPAIEIKEIINRLKMVSSNEKGLVSASLAITLLENCLLFNAMTDNKKYNRREI